MLKNKKSLIIIASVIVVIALLAGGYFVFAKKPTTTTPSAESPKTVDSGPVDLSSDDIGLKITSSADSKKIQFIIEKLSDIKSVSYELTYDADPSEQDKSEGGGDQRIQRGITGEAKFKQGDSRYESPWIDLGSCSKNVCKYDAGVTSVDLLLKIVKTDNKVYSTEKKLDL